MSRDKQNLSLPDHLFKAGKINTRQDRSHGQGIFIIHTKNVTLPFFFLFSFLRNLSHVFIMLRWQSDLLGPTHMQG